MVTCTGHIGIHEGADGRTDVVRTDVYDVMAIKPNFLTSMGYHIFLTMVLRARSSAIRTIVVDVIGQLIRDVVGRLSVEPRCNWLGRLKSDRCVSIHLQV